jgi:hypothetical protein
LISTIKIPPPTTDPFGIWIALDETRGDRTFSVMQGAPCGKKSWL